MEENLTPIIVAFIGALQVVLAIHFGRKLNEAKAKKESAGATEAIGSSYSTLVERLESRLDRLEEDYEALCEKYERDKTVWAAEKKELLDRIRQLERGNGI